MRIGVYDPYLDDMGGGEKYMLTLASCLSQNHDVTLFWNRVEDVGLANVRFSIDLSRVKVTANIFSHDVSFFKRATESKNYDALVVLSDGSVPLVFSKKLFLHVQQPIPGAKRGFKTKLKLARVTKVFCNSYFSKSFVDKMLGVESVVLYPPVELHPKKVKKENIILHVGRFRAANIEAGDYKKQGEMIKAFKKIHAKIPNWKFVIVVGVNVGQESEFREFAKQAKGAPIEFLVNKTNPELWDIYSKSKIYWHASGFGENLEDHPEYAEHFGISTVEAMGASCVPVVFNAGGQKEIVEDNISGFLWNTLPELEEKTLLLTREERIFDAMSKEATKRAKIFAGDRFCTEASKLITNG